MAVLGHDEIRSRLDAGEVFALDTWDENRIKEASYALTLAWDGLVIDGRPYPPDTMYPHSQIRIEPGKIAILSTKEVLRMPGDLSGKVGVRLEFAAVGLLGLMGIQVDPYYGLDKPKERLYFRVANLSNETIRLQSTDEVFNIELHEAKGATEPKTEKADGWSRMQQLMRTQRDTSWTYLTQIEQKAKETEERFQPLILFGVVLVAVTVLGVIATVMINTDASDAPRWFANWGYVVLLVTFVTGAASVALLVLAEASHRGAPALRLIGRFLECLIIRSPVRLGRWLLKAPLLQR